MSWKLSTVEFSEIVIRTIKIKQNVSLANWGGKKNEFLKKMKKHSVIAHLFKNKAVYLKIIFL